MNIDEQVLYDVDRILDRASKPSDGYSDGVGDLVLLHHYGQKCFSQFGLGLCGWSIRQQGQNHLLTVKVVESGIPLIAYVTSHTPTGCVEQLFYLLESDKIRWNRDRYPWI